MNEQRKTVLDKLNTLGIHYDLIEHPAVYTIEEMERLDIVNKNEIAKNLFLRDDKKKRYFLLVISKGKQVNLKELSKRINSRPLSFASEEALNICLGLTKGSVTPFGILNDESRKIEVMLDKAILSYQQIGVHPNDNTATVFLSLKDLEQVISDHGNTYAYIEI